MAAVVEVELAVVVEETVRFWICSEVCLKREKEREGFVNELFRTEVAICSIKHVVSSATRKSRAIEHYTLTQQQLGFGYFGKLH